MSRYVTLKLPRDTVMEIRRLVGKVVEVGIWNIPSPWRESWPKNGGKERMPGIGTTVSCAVGAMLASMRGD